MTHVEKLRKRCLELRKRWKDAEEDAKGIQLNYDLKLDDMLLADVLLSELYDAPDADAYDVEEAEGACFDAGEAVHTAEEMLASAQADCERAREAYFSLLREYDAARKDSRK